MRLEYLKQGLERYCKGKYIFKGTNGYHVKIEIIIEIESEYGTIQYIKTGWALLQNGEIKLLTPYSGHKFLGEKYG